MHSLCILQFLNIIINILNMLYRLIRPMVPTLVSIFNPLFSPLENFFDKYSRLNIRFKFFDLKQPNC
jgi:hypothetical protein